MFKTLLRKNFQEVGAMYFRSKKKGTVLNGGAKVGMIILYVFIYLSMLAAFSGISVALYMPINPEFDWVVWSVIGIMAVVMATLINAFTSYAQLYLARDNEFLISMPIKPGTIIFSRAVSVYLMGIVYASMAWIPTIIVGIVLGRMTPMMIAGSIITLFVVGFMVLALTCLIGWLIALMSLKLKNQKILLTGILLIFIFGLYYLQFKSNQLVEKLSQNIDKIGTIMESRIYPFYKLGKGVQGDIPSYLIFVAITAVLLVIAYYVLSRTFVKIATTSGSTKKAQFKQGQIRTLSVDKALLQRERRRFFGSITYMLNSGMGAIMMIAGAIILMIKSGDITKALGPLIEAIPEIADIMPLAVIAGLCMLISLSCTSSSSISIEGKQAWQIQTMPVSPSDVFAAKRRFSWYLQALPSILLYVACDDTLFTHNYFTEIVFVLFISIFADLSSTFGVFINLRHPNLDWVSEQTVIKQGMPVTLTIFGGWGFGLVVAALTYFAGKIIDYRFFLVAVTIAMFILVCRMDKWLDSKGSKIFATL